MKKRTLILFAVAAMMAMPVTVKADVILAGIDTWDDVSNPGVDVTTAGFTATSSSSGTNGAWTNADSGGDPGRGSSVDTTWGTFDGNGVAASAVTDVGIANFSLTNGKQGAEVTLTLTNNTADDYDLNMFHMDVVAFRPNAARTYSLDVLAGSDITVGEVFASAGTPMNDNSTDDITHLGGALGTGHDVHDDLDLDLSVLADNTLAVGETATIQITFSNGTGAGGGHHLFLDNVAISGDIVTAVPEPTSLAIFGLAGLGFMTRRRK